MIRRIPTLLAAVCLAAAPRGAEARDVETVLARMDAAAPAFRAVSANLSRESFTAIINERATESGACKFAKAKNGVRVLVEITAPAPRAFAFAGGKAQLYYPKINTVQEIDLGKQKSAIDQYILLGFGASGKELRKSYDVKYGGEEAVAGQPASRLELTPKSQQVRDQFAKIELWIAAGGGHPVRQKLHEPSGNYLTHTFTGIQLNPNLTPDSLAMKLPKDVKREYPQK